MLIIENVFLMGGYFASDDTGVCHEYPPPPTRVLAACFQACRLNGLERYQHVLKKIESLEAPSIYLGKKFEESKYNNQNNKKFFVPTAPSDTKKAPMLDGKNERILPVSYMKEPRVVYQWEHSNFSTEEKIAIDEILAEVTHIGRSESLVISRRVDEIDWSGLEMKYIPDSDFGNITIKTPEDGSIDSMCNAFDRDQYYDHWDSSFYRLETNADDRSSIWSEMIRFQIDGLIHIKRALPMIEAIRSQLMSLAEGGELPPIFHGHGFNGLSHVAIVPLSNVGNDYSRGMIKGFAVCLPRSISSEDRYDILRACERLYKDGFHLHGDHVSVLRAGTALSIQERRWCGPSRRWASVTPIALDLLPKKKLKLEGIIGRMCKHIGLPDPLKIVYRRSSFISGVPFSNDFHMKRKGTPPLGWGHAEIVFDDLVYGPIALGQLRHFGMGLFLPLGDRYED